MKVSRRRRSPPESPPEAGVRLAPTRTIGPVFCNGYEVTVTAALEVAAGPSAQGRTPAHRDRSQTNR